MENYLTQKEVLERASSWFTTPEICYIYGISDQTLKNWRRGSYFRGKRKVFFQKDGSFLAHQFSDPGMGVLYQIRDVNSWLRKIKREEVIPIYLLNF